MPEEVSGIDGLETLHREHQAVLSRLNTLQWTLLRLLKDQPGVVPEALNEIEAVVEFLEAELWIHLRKEEEILFPALSAYLGQEGWPIEVLLLEHQDLRRGLRAFSSELGILRADPESASPVEVFEVGYDLCGLLRHHIAKEDTCLFPMAGSSLDRGQLLALGEQMRAMAQAAGGPPRITPPGMSDWD